MSKAIHPAIYSLIKKIDAIHYNLLNDNHVFALNQMRLIVMGLKPEDKTSDIGIEIMEDIDKEILKLKGITSRSYDQNNAISMVELYTSDNFQKYLSFYDRINTILWDKEYLIDSKYQYGPPINEVDENTEEIVVN